MQETYTAPRWAQDIHKQHTASKGCCAYPRAYPQTFQESFIDRLHQGESESQDVLVFSSVV